MNPEFLAEMKARCTEGHPIASVDAKALVAEVERLTAENTKQRKALELICAHKSIQQWGLNTAQEIYDYFMQQVQAQEQVKEV